MRTFPSLRPRVASEPVNGALVNQSPTPGIPQKSVVAGGFGSALFSALFGVGFNSETGPDKTPPVQNPGLYHFHQGDLFVPGTGNYVYDPAFELPMKTPWSGSTNQGFLYRANPWKVLQPPQIFSQPTVKTSGIGGLQAGMMVLQPLESEEGT